MLPVAPASLSPAPEPSPKAGSIEAQAAALCGPLDAGLTATARWALSERSEGRALPEPSVLARVQRAAGEPHPWARAWAASGMAHATGASWLNAMRSLESWVGSAAGRRCGVAAAVSPSGVQTLVVVVVEVLADLAPVPTCVRVGQWLPIDALVRVPFEGARVLVMGPSGVPRTVPSHVDGRHVRAWLTADAPGESTVQVIANVQDGPRPVLEARVTATGTDAPQCVTSEAASQPSPSDDDPVATESPDAVGLLARVREKRAARALPPLLPDARLAEVARAHALAMMRAGRLAHDVGTGDPQVRLRAAGSYARAIAENVAHARTLDGAFQATWDSPAHRANFLRTDVSAIGAGVVQGGDGEIWIVVLLTSKD